MEIAGDADLKDAFIALASVAVVVWTGALVLKTALRIPSTWGVMSAMDLLQASFIVPIIALATPLGWYRILAIGFGLLYALSYALTLIQITPWAQPRLPAQARVWIRQADRDVPKARWIYAGSAVLFLSLVAVIAAFPTREIAFIASFVWFFVGLQMFLTAYHVVNPEA
jgi:hypothetical protein